MNPGLSTRARVVRTIGLLAACSLLGGCDDGPTAPTTPDISGSWQGSYQPGIASNFDPCDTAGPALAAFTQEGSRVRGTLATQSRTFVEGDFAGEIHGDHLQGTLMNNGTARNVTGSASAAQITLSVDLAFCSMNRIELHRQP